MKVKVGKYGELQLPKKQQKRWGLETGKEFQIKETFGGLLLSPLDPPLTKVYIEPTTNCNLSCQTCVRNYWEEPIGSMEMLSYRKLIDGLKKINSLQTVAFWGFGEPLLHPDIVEMISLAKRLGVRTEVITNGVLLDREMAEKLVLAGLDTLIVSIDGFSPKSYLTIRKGSDLSLVVANIKGIIAVAQNKSYEHLEVGIEFVVMRNNLSDLKFLHDFARSVGASFAVVSNVLPYTEELKDQILYWRSGGNLYPVRRSPWFPKITLPRIDICNDDSQPLFSLIQQLGTIDFFNCRDREAEASYCRFVNEGAMAISWDGEVSPCVPLMHSYKCYVLGREKNIKRYTLGNIAQQEVDQIWNRDEFRQFRGKVVEFDFSPCVNCGGCDFAESNEEDCFGNTFPVCGDCLWAQWVILCP